MSLEAEIINAQNTYLKMQQDIEELNVKRSKLQNEIESRLEELRQNMSNEYSVHQEKMAEESAGMKARQEELRIFEESANASIKVKIKNIEEQTIKISDGFTVLDQAKAQFGDYKNSELNRLAQKDSELRRRERNLELETEQLNINTLDLVSRVKNINNREFQIQWLIDENRRIVSEVTTQQIEFGNKLQAISDERKLITSEKDEIIKLLGELKQKEAALAQASTVKEDISELDKKKIEIGVLIKQNEELSKATAKKQEELREQAISLDEKQRALTIDIHKNDEKIQIIQKIREDMKKNA